MSVERYRCSSLLFPDLLQFFTGSQFVQIVVDNYVGKQGSA